MTLVDTNVLIDVLTSDSVWLPWSAEQLDRHRMAGGLQTNEIAYAELSVHMDSESELQRSLTELGINLERTPTAALFMAGETFHRYRSAGGVQLAILPDFFIGAHAQVKRIPILTRDVRRYRNYFPEVELIAPEE